MVVTMPVTMAVPVPVAVPVKKRQRPTKVLVLGAGMSGLACARELQHRGYSVLVVEARNRVGGRLKGHALHINNASSSHHHGSCNHGNGSSNSEQVKKEASVDNTKNKNKNNKQQRNDKRATTAAAAAAAAGSTTAHIDLGGALIHGIDDNPVAELTQQLGCRVKAVQDCLLLDATGWPVDAREDDRVSTAFNECLEATFRRAERAAVSEQHQPFGALFDTVRAERQRQQHQQQQQHPPTPNQSASANVNANVPGNNFHNTATSALWKWHQANLEVSCGASFPDLGYQWNEDEPYGFDGDHVALQESWKVVTEAMADKLDIMYQSPVQKIHVVYPTKHAKGAAAAAATMAMAMATTPVLPTTPLSTTSMPATSNTLNTPNTSNTTTTPNTTTTSNTTTTPSAASRSKKKKKNATPATATPPPTNTKTVRHSRRLRGEDITNASRSSQRANKGVLVDRFTTSEHSTNISTSTSTSSTRKRVRNDGDGGTSTSGGNKKKGNGASSNSNDDDDDDKSSVTAATGPRETIVQVTLQNGTVLEADHVVCTLPLGILKTDTVQFDPPLPAAKRDAVQRLGTGLLNKCAIAFDHVFWQDSDFLGLAHDEHSYLVLNGASYTGGQPVLIFMYGGAFAAEIESWTDTEIVKDCLSVLKTICGCSIPVPSDYFVTRWGKEEYSRMAFTYIPPGVDGFQELQAMSQPVCDASGQVPMVMFAGEHTTPYHPSTIHGAFLSGIREAYRLDCLLEPVANDHLVFSDDQLYQRTFAMKRKFRDTAQPAVAPVAAVPVPAPKKASTNGSARTGHRRRGAAGVMTLRSKPKSISVVKPPVKKQPTNGAHEPSRRSQRSLAVLKSPNSANGISYGDSPARNVTKEPERDLEAMEDRVLVRGVESYGHDFAYIRTTALPIFGSDRQRSLVQVQKRCQKLLSKSKKGKGSRSTRAWKTWVAEFVFPSVPKPKGARLVANINTMANTPTAAVSKSRSGRTVKPRLFLDI